MIGFRRKAVSVMEMLRQLEISGKNELYGEPNCVKEGALGFGTILLEKSGGLY